MPRGRSARLSKLGIPKCLGIFDPADYGVNLRMRHFPFPEIHREENSRKKLRFGILEQGLFSSRTPELPGALGKGKGEAEISGILHGFCLWKCSLWGCSHTELHPREFRGSENGCDGMGDG